MQTWQIKALELEASALKYVDGFVHEHALWFLMGIIYLLLALLVWVLSGGLRRKLLRGKHMPHLQPVIVVQLPVGSPIPSSKPFDPFPPFCESPDCDHHDYYPD
jgi:hypothetical protein